MSKNSSDKKIVEPDILEEKDDQMETEETIKLTEEEQKAKLLKDIKFDETKIEKLEPYEVEDILELSKEDWIQIFGDSEGILYFNRISKLKENRGVKRKKEEEEEEEERKRIFKWNDHIDYNNWKENKDKTDYANELLNQIEINLSGGVKKIEMETWLQDNEEKSSSIFIRKSQIELWNEVLKYLESQKKTHAIVTGNPGIGKSRSLAYFLRLLLKQKKTVVYETKKDKNAHIFFAQEDGSYKVWSCINFMPEGCAHLKNSENYYLIDPDLPSQIVNVPAHTVLSASPNALHVKEFHKRAKTFLMSIWQKMELKALIDHIKVDGKKGLEKLSIDEFEQRYKNFGGRIRYIFSSFQLNGDNFEYLQDSVSKVKLETLIKALSYDIIDVSQSEEGLSMIFVYVVIPNPEETYKYAKIRSNYIVSLGSETIRQRLTSKYWKEIMETINPNSGKFSGNNTANGRLFEMIASVYLEFDVTLKAYDENHKHDHDLSLNQTNRTEFHGNWEQYLNYCSKLNNRELVIPTVKNQPVLDFMDQFNRAYQIAVGKTHGINRKHIQKIIEDFKFTKNNPLYLYFVTPECNLNEFQWNYEKDFTIDPRVLSIEKKTADTLRKELKDTYKGLSKKNKEELVKLMLNHKNIQSETSEEIPKKIEESLKIFYICIPEKAHKKIDELIEQLQKI